MSRSDITVQVASDSEYENLIAEIYYRGKFVGLVSQEQGLGKFEFELLVDPQPPEELRCRTVPLDVLMFALESAKAELIGH